MCDCFQVVTYLHPIVFQNFFNIELHLQKFLNYKMNNVRYYYYYKIFVLVYKKPRALGRNIGLSEKERTYILVEKIMYTKFNCN